MSEDSEHLAKLKPQVYKDPRPASYFDRFYNRAANRDPDWIYRATRMLLTIPLLVGFRARCIGSYNVPKQGALIMAPNHFSNMDHFLVAMYIRRYVQFMAKSQLFKRPIQWILTHGGSFPIRRGHRDERAFDTAKAILKRGSCVLMYCEGGRSRTGKIADHAKAGIGRLALESGVPVVPVALFGSAKIRNWKKFQIPSITIQYGEPIAFPVEPDASHERQQQVADEILNKIRALYNGLATDGRKVVRQRLQAEAAN